MNFSGIYNQANSALYVSFGSVQSAAVNAKNWTAGSFIWTKVGQPLYEKKISRLTRTDGIVIGTALFSAAVLAHLALNKLNQAFFPITMMGSLILVMGSHSYAQYRINRHYDGVAAEYIGQLRTQLQAITQVQHEFAPFQAILSNMEHKSEFNHLEQHLKTLDEKIKELQTKIVDPAITEKNFDDAKISLGHHLEALQLRLS